MHRVIGIDHNAYHILHIVECFIHSHYLFVQYIFSFKWVIPMSLSLHDHTHLVCSLQRMITTLLNHHTWAVAASRHHHQRIASLTNGSCNSLFCFVHSTCERNLSCLSPQQSLDSGIFAEVQQSTVLHLMFFRQMMMFFYVCLQRLIVSELFFVILCHSYLSISSTHSMISVDRSTSSVCLHS